MRVRDEVSITARPSPRQVKGDAMPREAFLDLLALCRYRRLGWDPEPAMQRADRAYAMLKRNGFEGQRDLGLEDITAAIYGVRLELLGSRTTKDWCELRRDE